MMFGMGFGFIIWLLVLILIGWGAFNIFGANWRQNRPFIGDRNYSNNAEALEILKQRYARGEVSKTEYERMKKDIIGS